MANILLVYNTPGWAHHHMAVDIQRWAPESDNVQIMSNEHLHAAVLRHGHKAFDIVDQQLHITAPLDAMSHFYYPSASTLFSVTCRRYVCSVDTHGIRFKRSETPSKDNWESWAASQETNASTAVYCLGPLASVIAINKPILDAALTFNERAILCLPGVNVEIFSPDNTVAKRKTFTVGWCGAKTTSVKCHDQVLMPLVVRKTMAWDIHTCSNPVKAKSRTDMAKWYNALDAFICTSVCEGTPCTVMEAAACGVPVVSTNVGIIQEWPEMHDLGLVVPIPANEKAAITTIREIDNRLIRLRDDMAYRRRCSEVLLQSVRKRFSWEHLAPQWVRAIAGD